MPCQHLKAADRDLVGYLGQRPLVQHAHTPVSRLRGRCLAARSKTRLALFKVVAGLEHDLDHAAHPGSTSTS